MGSCLSGDRRRGGAAGGASDNEGGRQQEQRSYESTVRSSYSVMVPICVQGVLYNIPAYA